MTSPIRLLLGPQRPTINLGTAVRRAGLDTGTVAVISAGWQEAEGDIDDVRRALEIPLIDLGIYQRSDAVFQADESLLHAYRTRQDALIEQQRMYRLRLRQLTIAARAILRSNGSKDAIAEERRHAISQLRALDRHHLRQIRKLNARFEGLFNVGKHEELARQHAEIRELLSHCNAVLITGGNVVVLMNRLALLGIGQLLGERNIIAWSAGAMVLCDNVVLFHDRLPQGRRDPEMMCQGLGIVPGKVLLPDAKGRLRGGDPVRSSLFSRRFAPAECLTLDNDSYLLYQGEKLECSDGARRLTQDGAFTSVTHA
jgi:hypothetical protein